jgi:hypothetical protein
MNWDPRDPKSFILFQMMTDDAEEDADEQNASPNTDGSAGCSCLALLIGIASLMIAAAVLFR